MRNKHSFRKKRSDTLIKNIEKTYGVDFGVRNDMKLSTYLKRKNLPSLGKAIDRINSSK